MTLHAHFITQFFALLTYGSAIFIAERAQCDEPERPPLLSRWAEEVSRESPWPEYPRPQLVRETWQNLNGMWQLNIQEASAREPTSYSDQILVPFPLESFLSGVGKYLLPTEVAWYRRRFEVDPHWQGQRILLHFGAVDWHTRVWINGESIGEHRGGYDSFTFDISEAINFGGNNEIVIAVADPTDTGSQPRGKQVLHPEGIWYTPSSGIWQTVWLEPVAESYVKSLQIVPDLKNSSLTIKVNSNTGKQDLVARIEVLDHGKKIAAVAQSLENDIALDIKDAHAWSPNDPFLYDLRVELVEKGKVVDRVASYFGMRSIELAVDQYDIIRMQFNDVPLFQFGPLDQGYWPDSLYTAPSDEAMRYDLEVIKRLGFNMVRKHVKVEPARWYYWCDKLGLLVWQDMPSGGESPAWPADGLETERTQESAAQYRTELQAMIDGLRNFACIVVWVPFNESWGQFDTVAITKWVKEYDPSRLVISASGGNDFGCGDINDDHFYPGPGGPPAEKSRAAVLGEFGGFGLPLVGHTWQDEKNWGYRSYHSAEQVAAAYEEVVQKLRPIIESHLSAAVYTQLTDVEVEVNGLMTYDREIIKPHEAAIRAANLKLYEPLPEQSPAEKLAASVLAWWRFEEGDTGISVSDLSDQMGAIAARDFSGHNNHLFAFSAANAPSIGDRVSSREFGLIKVNNSHCLDDTNPPAQEALTRDLFTNPDVSRTHMDKVERFPFSDWTIEASFSLSKHTGDQVVLSKEEDISGVFYPLFQLGVFGSTPTIGVELVDQAGEKVMIQSDLQADINEWLHVAVTCRDGLVQLFVAGDDDSSDYALAGEAQIANSLALRGGTWLVGRGCESGKMGRDFLGWIDEIRISTKALEKSQFLFGNTQEFENLK